jgi:hypothetical protein
MRNPPVDLTTLAATVDPSTVPPEILALCVPAGPEPFSPDRVMSLLFEFGNRLTNLEAQNEQRGSRNGG